MKKRLAIVLAGLGALALVSGFAIAKHPGGESGDGVQIAVWQSASDPSRIYLSTRAGGGWETASAPLRLSAMGESGRYLRSEIVSVETPAPAPYKPESVGATATARMKGADGSDMGTVTIEQGPHGLIIMADLHGLSEGGHGFHIHETGACEPDFKAAGGHLEFAGRSHGARSVDGSHAGDLPNLFAGADGSARADVFTNEMTLDAARAAHAVRRRRLGHHHPRRPGRLRGHGERGRARGLRGDPARFVGARTRGIASPRSVPALSSGWRGPRRPRRRSRRR